MLATLSLLSQLSQKTIFWLKDPENKRMSSNTVDSLLAEYYVPSSILILHLAFAHFLEKVALHLALFFPLFVPTHPAFQMISFVRRKKSVKGSQMIGQIEPFW